MRRLGAGCVALGILVLASCAEEEAPVAPAPPPPSQEVQAPADVDLLNGEVLYVQRCLTCHQADGSGVPNMQPSLTDHPTVTGEPSRLIEVTLLGIGGTEPALPATGMYAMNMPGYPDLTDKDVADLLSYIRQTFAGAGPVSAEEVGAVRAGLD